MINEIITSDNVAYYDFYKKYSKHLSSTGLILVLDVTVKKEGLDYLPIILNEQTTRFIKENIDDYKTLIPLACSENDVICNARCYSKNIFYVSHSQKKNDKSKVTYRVIGRRDFVNSVIGRLTQKGNVIDWDEDKKAQNFCVYVKDRSQNVDAFSIGNSGGVSLKLLWDGVYELCDESLYPFLNECSKQGCSIPVVGYEIQNSSDEVIAEFELAWPDKRIGVVEEKFNNSMNITNDWQVFTFKEVECDLENVVSII
jgi:hypothetical protein